MNKKGTSRVFSLKSGGLCLCMFLSEGMDYCLSSITAKYAFLPVGEIPLM